MIPQVDLFSFVFGKISKANCQAENSSKKRTNEFVFLRFFEEIKDSKKAFRNYVTFKRTFRN